MSSGDHTARTLPFPSAPTTARLSLVSPPDPSPGSLLVGRARRAVGRGRRWLLAQQEVEGYWSADLEGPATAESERILLSAFLGRSDDRVAVGNGEHLLASQRPEGGWSAFPRGPLEVTVSVKAYFALKLLDHSPSSEPMQRARRAILAHGGADRIARSAHVWLALFGQIDHRRDGRDTSNDAFQQTARAIIATCRPIRQIAPWQGIRELFLKSPADWIPAEEQDDWTSGGWTGRLGQAASVAIGWMVEMGRRACRQTGLPRDAEDRITRYIQQIDPASGDPTALQLGRIALDCLGHDEDSEIVRRYDEALDTFVRRETAGICRVRAARTPVDHTALALRALREGGLGTSHQAVQRGVDWLTDRPSPDPASTAMTLLALLDADECPKEAFGQLGRRKPVEADVIGRVLEALGQLGRRTGEAEIDRLVRLLHEAQRADGSWAGTLGVHYIHGTYQAILGLTAVGVSAEDSAVVGGVAWLTAHQQPDGGWGETPCCRENPSLRGHGPVTPTQTAWAVTALTSAGLSDHPAVIRGVEFLLDHQQRDGSWASAVPTRTLTRSIPSEPLYVHDPLHAVGFPMMALHQWSTSPAAKDVEPPPHRVADEEPKEVRPVYSLVGA